MSVVRISLARFDASQYEAIRQLLDEAQATLIPAIRALRGNLAFYAGIDRENCAMQNVSIWETLADAKDMAALAALFDADIAGGEDRIGVQARRDADGIVFRFPISILAWTR